MKQQFVVFDVETTGNSPLKGDKIIQLAAVVVEDGKIIGRFSSFVNPKQDIPPFIEQLTGITNEMVKDAPTFPEIAEEVKNLLHHAYFVAHNVLFDFSFIQEELKNAGMGGFSGPKLDTVELTRILFPTLSGYKLSQLAKTLSIAHEHPHQADSDAEVTAELLILLLSKLESLPSSPLKKMRKFISYLQSDLEGIVAPVLQEKIHSVQEDEVFFEYYKDIAIKKKRENINEKQSTLVDFEKAKTYVKKRLRTIMKNFEYRHGQMEMMDIISEAMQTNQHALIEAGMGIGKTLAYLIPSAIHAKRTQKPVIISTYTLQLQQQILEKEIPILKELLPYQIQVAILKGRSNYINLPKFNRALLDMGHNYDTALTVLQILVWLTETNTGDMDELNLPTGGVAFWEKVKSSSAWFQRDMTIDQQFDFYFLAKERAKKADLIITNHSLFFANTSGDSTILPVHDTIIFDEAHHLESVASEYLGVKISYNTILFQLMRIGTFEQPGLMKKTAEIFEKCQKKSQLFVKMGDTVQNLLLDFDDLFRLLRSYALHHKKSHAFQRICYRFDIKNEDGQMWDSILELVLRVQLNLEELLGHFDRQKESVANFISDLSEKEQSDIEMYFSFQPIFEKLEKELIQLFFQRNQQQVTWIETEEKGAQNAASLYCQYIEICDIIANQIFSKKKSVILTSATLSTEGTFSFLVQQLGLEYFYPICVSIPSPFLYKEQIKLMVPTDLPAVNYVSTDEYVLAISNHIVKIALQLQRRMLVLFTSYEMLKATYNQLSARLDLADFILIGQGISGGSRTKLTKSFLQFSKSILLGTNSFWEGIDLPGDDLSCLIIIRLPFASPENPIVEAKSHFIGEAGGDPFHDFSLPNAIIRFKQGFGRLIRSKDDKGVIFVFDKRIVTKRYGKKFIASLPEIDVQTESLPILLDNLKQWL